MIRGLLIGVMVLFAGLCFTSFPWVDPFYTVLIAVLASVMFAQFGFLAAVLSKSFDSLTMFTNFLILPLIYLGGLFYPVEQLPGFWSKVALANPLAYLISAFRKSVLGVEGVSYVSTFLIVGFFCLAFFVLNWRIVKTGYRLRS